MQIILTRETKFKAIVELANDNGVVVRQRKVNRFSERDIKWLSKTAKWSVGEATDYINRVCEDENGKPYGAEIDTPEEVAKEQPNDNAFNIIVRELNQHKKTAVSYCEETVEDTLKAAFNFTVDGVEPLLEWYDVKKLCCLDIDYHNVEVKPTLDELQAQVSTIKPLPFCWHPSHGFGAKLYYVATPGFTAEELAAVAGLQWIQTDPRATFDLIKSTRHPSFARSRDNAPAPVKRFASDAERQHSEGLSSPLPHPQTDVDSEIILHPVTSGTEPGMGTDAATNGRLFYLYGSGDLSAVRRYLSAEFDFSEIEEWLNERGWKIGQTLPHSLCPIEPSDSYKDVVFVGDKGIYCHKCEAKKLGGSIPGFVSYGSLIGGADNRIAKMVKNFVHLEHAKIVLENIFQNVPQKILETVYRVMMKIVHTPDDPRIAMAMTSGKGFIRVRGAWVSTDGEVTIAKGLDQYVQSLPATLVPKEDGFGINIPARTAFLNSCSIDDYGYHDITFLRGCKIYGQHMPCRSTELVKVLTRREFKDTAPKYLLPNKRMDIEKAWGMLDEVFPGVDRKYIQLLICAKGAAEGRLVQCPFLLITGPSGAGKSTTVHIAAGICGDKADEPIFETKVDRFRQALMDSARSSGFVCVNEVFKMADRSRMSYTQALDPMLSLTEDSRSHVMYVGSVPFGRLPVFVLTDINIPKEVEADIQLARRFAFYRLSTRNYWNGTIVQHNIRPHEMRLISPDHNLACDTILSDVIDTYFSEHTTFEEIIKRIGLPTLETISEETDDKKGQLLRLFNEVKNAKAIAGSHAIRYSSAKGWKVIDRTEVNPLSELWGDLADGQLPQEWVRSRTVEAEDWGRVLGTGFPVVCDIRPYKGSIVYIRFRSVDSPKSPSWINGETVK